MSAREPGPLDVSPLRVDDAVILRELRPDDDRTLVQLVEENQAFLSRWLPWAHGYSLETARDFIESRRSGYLSGSTLELAVEIDGRQAGMIGLHTIDWDEREAEIGYWLAERHNGRGTMTSACRRLIDHAFGTLGLRRIVIQAAGENIQSRAIPERLGFRLEEEAGLARYALGNSEWSPDD